MKRGVGPPILSKPKAVKRLRYENQGPPILRPEFDMVSDDGEDEDDGGIGVTSTPKKLKSHPDKRANKLATKKQRKLATEVLRPIVIN